MRSASLVAPSPGSLLAWWLALRPWSFTISLAPVLAGTSLAGLDGHPLQLGLVLAALAGSVLIHAGTNLQNDVGDFRRGADLVGRIGPRRATTEGWLSARQVQGAATLCFTLAVQRGRRFTTWEYAALMHAPFPLAVLLAIKERQVWLLAPLVLLPWATVLFVQIKRNPTGAWLNGALAATAKLGLAFAVLLS